MEFEMMMVDMTTCFLLRDVVAEGLALLNRQMLAALVAASPLLLAPLLELRRTVSTALTVVPTEIVPASVDGSPRSASTRFLIQGIAVDTIRGGLFLSDGVRDTILKLLPNSTVVTLAGSSDISCGFADGVGRSASLWRPTGLVFDGTNDILYFVDSHNYCIRAMTNNGTVMTIAGSPHEDLYRDGPFKSARFSSVFTATSLCRCPLSGDLFVSEHLGPRRIEFAHVVTKDTLSSTSGFVSTILIPTHFRDTAEHPICQITGSAVCPITGHIIVSDRASDTIYTITSPGKHMDITVKLLAKASGSHIDGHPGSAKFVNPTVLCIDSSGTIFVSDLLADNDCDYGNDTSTIRCISRDGFVSTLSLPESLGMSFRGIACACLADPEGSALFVVSTLDSSIFHITPQ